MDDVVITSSEQDSVAIEAVIAHHAQLAGALAARVERLVAAAAEAADESAWSARDELVAWCSEELVPHAMAEEEALYPAAHRRAEGRLLIEGMLGEHRVLLDLVDEVSEATDAVRAAAHARALLVMFRNHVAKENELVLPLLGAAPDVAIVDVLAGMHELLSAEETVEQADGCGGHGCACGEVDGPGYPELDARVIPHAIRHATIFGALDTVAPGDGLVLVAPHDPVPLLSQLQERAPDAFTVSYLERGPGTWRLVLVRTREPVTSSALAAV